MGVGVGMGVVWVREVCEVCERGKRRVSYFIVSCLASIEMDVGRKFYIEMSLPIRMIYFNFRRIFKIRRKLNFEQKKEKKEKKKCLNFNEILSEYFLFKCEREA